MMLVVRSSLRQPSTVSKVIGGDNTEVPEIRFLNRRNAGDQDAYDEYTLYGLGTFGIRERAGLDDMVEIVRTPQIWLFGTDPRVGGSLSHQDNTNQSRI